MNQNYHTAIAVYEDALTLLAQRADPTSALDLRPLQSIVGQLFAHETGQSFPGYYRPQRIHNQAALPEVEPPTSAELLAEYQKLSRQLTQEVGQYPAEEQDPKVREANLHALLHRYGWAVPAPGMQDVSLYDYARTTAAFNVCQRDPAATDQNAALLVGGDVSGVQDWIYALSSRGVAKGLRGRSFYLQLLAEVIAHYVLDRLDLPDCNLLYVGGGNFYLLVPVSSEKQLTTIQVDVSRKLLRMHEGALYVALGYAPISSAMITGRGDKISSAWDAVNRSMGRAKSQRFAELQNDEMTTAIGSPLPGSEDPLNTCGVCRRVMGKGEGKEIPEDTTNSRKCDLCSSFEQLGNQLRTAEFLVLSRLNAISDSDGVNISDWRKGLAQFGYDVQLVDGIHGNKEIRGWRPVDGDMVRIYYWQDEPDINTFPGWPGNHRTVWGFRPLAQCIPITAENEIATFEKLETEGIDRWGVLRMDVDNLGKIFQEGLPGGSLSQVVGLSSLLRLYFEGHVPRIAAQYNRIDPQTESPRIYLMYAGGDDLFIVGGWSYLPDLAHEIRRDFSEFACQNPKCTISGGISIALDANYPLYQAARQAGEAEHQAKHKTEDDKNALGFLGEVMSWNGEYDRVRSRVNDLRRWLGEGEGKLPRSFLMTLRAIDGEWREWKKQESGQKKKHGVEPKYQHNETTLYLGPWQWHLVYSLTRAAERTKDSEMRRLTRSFAEQIIDGEIIYIGLIARWTELWTRTQDTRKP